MFDSSNFKFWKINLKFQKSLWQKFFTCFSDYYNNFEGDCEFENIKGVLENDQLPFLRSQASDVMASCYKDFEPYETEAGQDGDHGNDGDHDNLVILFLNFYKIWPLNKLV